MLYLWFLIDKCNFRNIELDASINVYNAVYCIYISSVQLIILQLHLQLHKGWVECRV